MFIIIHKTLTFYYQIPRSKEFNQRYMLLHLFYRSLFPRGQFKEERSTQRKEMSVDPSQVTNHGILSHAFTFIIRTITWKMNFVFMLMKMIKLSVSFPNSMRIVSIAPPSKLHYIAPSQSFSSDAPTIPSFLYWCNSDRIIKSHSRCFGLILVAVIQLTAYKKILRTFWQESQEQHEGSYIMN